MTTTPSLTPRESEIVELLATGEYSQKEIAAIMGIGESTLRTHLQRAMFKANKRTPIGLVVWWYEHVAETRRENSDKTKPRRKPRMVAS